MIVFFSSQFLLSLERTKKSPLVYWLSRIIDATCEDYVSEITTRQSAEQGKSENHLLSSLWDAVWYRKSILYGTRRNDIARQGFTSYLIEPSSFYFLKILIEEKGPKRGVLEEK